MKVTKTQIGAALTFAAGGASFVWMKKNSDDIPRDLSATYRFIKLRRRIRFASILKGWNAADCYPLEGRKDKEFMRFISDDDTVHSFTYYQTDCLANQLANFLREKGVKHKDVIALMMDNKPEFIITWLAASKIGATTALINVNLKGQPLIHSFVSSGASKMIIGSEYLEVVKEMRETVNDNPDKSLDHLKTDQYYAYGTNTLDSFIHIDTQLNSYPNNLIGGLPKQRNCSDAHFYIYTSGTTGLPKASVITNQRFYNGGVAFSTIYDIKESDIFYTCLPFYHSAATLIAVSSVIFTGATLVFRKKFSTSKYWSDCKKNNCSVAQYIGEICTYLLERPELPDEKDHNLKLMIGNGLRPSVWARFQERFNVPQIGEFYMATEGNAYLFNFINKQNAVGFLPNMIQGFYPLRIIKYDVENDDVIRGQDGLCQECGPNEIGQLVSAIWEGDPTFDFQGYTNKKATQKKILTDVLEKGDKYFATGDLLKKDSSGFYYFMDRIGDTFRWKGENVSTSEVEAVLQNFDGIKEVTVYGVKMPSSLGRAGMAKIVCDDNKEIDMKKLYKYCSQNLPSYASPIFIRIGKEISLTGTYKHVKVQLKEDGFNPIVVKDPLYIKSSQDESYIPLTTEMFKDIMSNTYSAKL